MSIQAITSAMGLREVTPSEKLLLLALANYADENLRCYPSQRRLAEDTCLSDRTIRNLLVALEGRGLLARQERLRNDGSRSTDVITLRFSPAQISGGAEVVSRGVRKLLPGGAETASRLTSFEPSPEPSIEPVGSATDAPRPTKASKRCPDSFSPNEATISKLTEEGFSPGEIERALTRMRDHEFKIARSDWNAALRNWTREDRDRKPKANQDAPRPDPKLIARQANYADAFAGSEAASRLRRTP